MAQANGGLSNHVKDTCRSRADRSTLIKAQLSAHMYVATERGTSDNTEATRFSQCAHDQRRRLEAEDCNSIRCAQLISGKRRRICPPHCLAHARPTMCCIRLVIIIMHRLASLWPATFSPTGYGLLMHCSRKQHIHSNAWHYHTLSVVHNQRNEFQITCTIGPLS